MKVLHINAGLENGGGLYHIVNLLTAAQKQGEDFSLLCLAEGPVAQMARKKGLKVQVLGISSRYDLRALNKLRAFIDAGHYDIVHTHGARSNLFVALISKKIKAKWVVTVHSDPYLDFAGRGLTGKVFTALNLRALRRADCVLAITRRFANLLIEKAGVKASRVKVIYNGIFFHDDSELPAKISHNTFNIINVARCEKVKGQSLLLKAIKNCGDSNLRLHIAGDGSQLSALKEEARSLQIAPQVTFHGFLSQRELTQLYRQADLAVLTSYSESFPLVLLEASDNLVPILSTDIGDIRKMIPNSNQGLIVHRGDLASITQGLKKALTLSLVQRQQMAAREKTYVQENFSVARQLDSILTAYQNYGKMMAKSMK